MTNSEQSRISGSLYTATNDIIGTKEQVNIRRTVTNLRDDVLKRERTLTNSGNIPYSSGSKAEGLRLKSPDDGWMYVPRSFRVIPSYLFTSWYDHSIVLLKMENEMTRPGFALLRVPDYVDSIDMGRFDFLTNQYMYDPTMNVPELNGRYMSSKKWREFFTATSPTGAFTHGNCTSAVNGPHDAYRLQCDVWPDNARSSVKRMYENSWPSPDIIHSIIKDGVLFVAVGSRRTFFQNLEWRMSFSLAEKRLIHSMNHAQFLCYGLLKIFLKEAIDVNEDVKGLLCSDFLKTAVFWEITESPNHWNPSTLLFRFWKCFCRLLQWVNCSYCPNFFIPENNMLEGNIEGENRAKLLRYLRTLHREGFRSLLRCRSLKSRGMSDVLNDPGRYILEEGTLERRHFARTVLVEQWSGNPLNIGYPYLNDEILALQLYRTMSTTRSCLKQYITSIWLKRSMTQISVFRSSHALSRDKCNKSHYENHMQRMKVLNRCRADPVCHFVYQAMACYNIRMYSQSLKLVQLAKEELCSQSSIYLPIAYTRRDRQRDDHLPIESRMRKCIMDVVKVQKLDLPELYIESHCDKNIIIRNSLPIFPMVCVLFLQFLCHSKLRNQRQCDEAMNELALRIQVDRHHIEDLGVPLAWQVLGICQQMKGDNSAACHSYLMALRHEKNYNLGSTCIRLGTILVQYF